MIFNVHLPFVRSFQSFSPIGNDTTGALKKIVPPTESAKIVASASASF
jgi:hypothetical protein